MFRASALTVVCLCGLAGLTIIACSSGGGKSDNGGSGGENSGGGNAGTAGGGAGASGSGGSIVGSGGGAGQGSGGAAGLGGVSNTGGKGGGAADAGAGTDAAPSNDKTMSFFVTSKGKGKGGDLGGLDGADAHCKALAMAVSPALGAKNWKAYLSTSTVNAIARIGNGPWYNAKGVVVAKSVQELHNDQTENAPLSATWPVGDAAFAVILDEKGGMHVNDVHDMLTGSTAAGMVDGSNHCSNWTSQTGMAAIGHSNRSGGNRPPSWNATHTVGCGSELNDSGMPVNRVAGTVTSGGGRGSFYCFVP